MIGMRFTVTVAVTLLWPTYAEAQSGLQPATQNDLGPLWSRLQTLEATVNELIKRDAARTLVEKKNCRVVMRCMAGTSKSGYGTCAEKEPELVCDQ